MNERVGVRLRAEARAFGATTRKEWAEIRRYPASFVSLAAWAILLPLIHVAQARGFAGGDPRAVVAFADRAGTAQVAGYLYLGWAVHLWISVVLWGPGVQIRQEQVRGTLEALFLTRASRLTTLFGGAPAHLVPALSIFITVFVALRTIFGVPLGPAEVIRALVVLVVATPALIAMGGLFATVVLRFSDADGLVQAVRGVLTLLCGVTFPLAVLPSWAREIGAVLPPTHVITALRSAVLGDAGWLPARSQWLALLVAALLLGVVAVLAFAWSVRRSRRTGRLGQF